MSRKSSSIPSRRSVLLLLLLATATLPAATSFVVATFSPPSLESIGSASSSLSQRSNRRRLTDVQAATPLRSTTTTWLLSATRTSTSSAESESPGTKASRRYTVQVVEGGEGDPRVVDIATYRNNMVSPQMMVERAKAKRDALDTTKAALDGLKVGLLYVGPIIAIGTYFGGSKDITEALTNYALLGGGLGGVLAVNNYLGKGVHVPDVPEATNRIVVDFSEGVLRQQDVGFVAIVSPQSSDDSAGTLSQDSRIFGSTNGVIATVDGQLRNSAQSPSGVRKVPNLPSHFHIKNMDVHYKMRRQGVAKALMELVINYAKERTDAKALTLEVEAANQPAVQLYRKFGFETQENPNWRSKNIFMVKDL